MLSDASEIIYILSLDAYRDEPVCITCMSTLRSTSRSLTWIGRANNPCNCMVKNAIFREAHSSSCAHERVML